LRLIVEQVDDRELEADEPDKREPEEDGHKERETNSPPLFQDDVRRRGHDTSALRLFV